MTTRRVFALTSASFLLLFGLTFAPGVEAGHLTEMARCLFVALGLGFAALVIWWPGLWRWLYN